MTSTAKEIVHQIQNEFDDLLNFVVRPLLKNDDPENKTLPE